MFIWWIRLKITFIRYLYYLPTWKKIFGTINFLSLFLQLRFNFTLVIYGIFCYTKKMRSFTTWMPGHKESKWCMLTASDCRVLTVQVKAAHTHTRRAHHIPVMRNYLAGLSEKKKICVVTRERDRYVRNCRKLKE